MERLAKALFSSVVETDPAALYDSVGVRVVLAAVVIALGAPVGASAQWADPGGLHGRVNSAAASSAAGSQAAEPPVVQTNEPSVTPASEPPPTHSDEPVPPSNADISVRVDSAVPASNANVVVRVDSPGDNARRPGIPARNVVVRVDSPGGSGDGGGQGSGRIHVSRVATP
jgi:hypothetical protein